MEKFNLYPYMLEQQQFQGQPQVPPTYNGSQQQGATLVLQQLMIGPFGPHPQMVQCSNCGERNITTVEYENGNKTHIAALFMCLVGLWCCFCIPYCVDSLKNANHYCPKCKNFLGVYTK